MTPNLEELALSHAINTLPHTLRDKPAWYYSIDDFKSGYTRAIADVVEWLRDYNINKDITISEYCADKIENKFLKGEK